MPLTPTYGSSKTSSGASELSSSCVCNFEIFVILLADDSAEIQIINHSDCPLDVTALTWQGTGLPITVTPAAAQTIPGLVTQIYLATETGTDIRGLTGIAATSCGERTFEIPVS